MIKTKSHWKMKMKKAATRGFGRIPSGAYRKLQATYIDPKLPVVRTPPDRKLVLIRSLNGMVVPEIKTNFEQDGACRKRQERRKPFGQILQCRHWCQQWAPQRTGPGTSGSCVPSRRRNLKPWTVDCIFVTTGGSKLLRRKKCTLQWLAVVSTMSRESARWDLHCTDSSFTSGDSPRRSQFGWFCISRPRD